MTALQEFARANAHGDPIADLYEALHKRGIRFMVYLPSGAPNADPAADAALEWRDGPYRNREFQRKWEQVIREWSERWGRKVAGWWFDGCYFPNAMYRSPQPPNFASFAGAARAGNPDTILPFNPGVVHRILSLTPNEDYTAGEIDQPNCVSMRRSIDGKVDGAQIHVLSHLGASWGSGAPRFSGDQVVNWSRKIREAGGTITWDTPVELNGTIAQVDQLAVVAAALGSR